MTWRVSSAWPWVMAAADERWGAAQARLRLELSDAAEAAAQAASAAEAREVRLASQRDAAAADLRRVTTELDDLRVATEVKSRADRCEARAAAEAAARTSADAADAREAALTVGRCRLTL